MFFKNGAKSEKKVITKPKTMVFVDFEHWYISLDKRYHRRPQIREWRDTLSEEFDIVDIYFFADFSNPSLQGEVAQIREVTNFVIETGNTSQFYKKDFTDFIMLDRIYQTAFDRPDIDAYIIFSGDGHFSSVVRFLTMKQNKIVGVYGIRDSVSQQLKNSATWVRELPESVKELRGCYYPILSNLYHIEKERDSGKSIYPSFRATVDAVSRYYKIDSDTVRGALQQLIDFGYIDQFDVTLSSGLIKTLKVDWGKAGRDGIWVDKSGI